MTSRYTEQSDLRRLRARVAQGFMPTFSDDFDPTYEALGALLGELTAALTALVEADTVLDEAKTKQLIAERRFEMLHRTIERVITMAEANKEVTVAEPDGG